MSLERLLEGGLRDEETGETGGGGGIDNDGSDAVVDNDDTNGAPDIAEGDAKPLLGAEQPKPGAEETASKADWRESVKDPDLNKYAQSFNTIEDLVKNALYYRQKLSNAVHMPGDDATDEEKQAFNKQLGVPEKPEDYEYKLPEELPETLNEEALEPIITNMREALHKSGATKKTAEAVLSESVDMLRKSHEEAAKQWQESIKQGEQTLKNEWGGDYERNTNFAKRAFSQFGGEDFESLLQQAKVGDTALINHPVMVKAFSEIGRKMGEGGMQYVATQADTQSFEQQQSELTNKAHIAMEQGNRMDAERLFKERDEAAARYYGSH